MIKHLQFEETTHQYYTVSVFIHLDVWLHIVIYLETKKRKKIEENQMAQHMLLQLTQKNSNR